MQLPSFLPDFFQLPDFDHTGLIVVKVLLSLLALTLPFFVGLVYAKQLGLNDQMKFVGVCFFLMTSVVAFFSFIWPPKPAQVVLVYVIQTEEDAKGQHEQTAVVQQVQKEIGGNVQAYEQDAIAVIFPFRSEAHLSEMKEKVERSREREALPISDLFGEKMLPTSPVISALQTGFIGCVFSFAVVFGFGYLYWQFRMQWDGRLIEKPRN